MHGRSYPILGLLIVLGLWLTTDCQSEANPADAAAVLLAPKAEEPELTAEQMAVLEFLQKEGLAGLILYGGYVTPPPPKTGVTDVPKDPPKDTTGGGNPNEPPDGGGNPPEEPPPEEGPEPTSLLLGLMGLGVTSVAYARRRKRKEMKKD